MLTSPTPLRDSDLRAALAATIAHKYRGRDHLLAPEVDILCGIPGRIDALLIANKICGFEIKSDVDSLHRLPRQLEAYEPVLERAVLIVGRRHLEAAQKILPQWWGIWLAERRGTRVAHCRAADLLSPILISISTRSPHSLRARSLPCICALRASRGIRSTTSTSCGAS